MMGAINSACNPVLYCLFMPSFRRALSNTILPCIVKNNDDTSQEGSSASTAETTDSHT